MINKINTYQNQPPRKKNHTPSFEAIAINKENYDLARQIFGDDKCPNICLQHMIKSKFWANFLTGIEAFIPTKLKTDFLIIFSPQEIKNLKKAKIENNQTYLQKIVQNVKQTGKAELLNISNLQFEKTSTETALRLKKREIENAFHSEVGFEI